MQTHQEADTAQTAPMQDLVMAAARGAQAIERATLWPWIVTVGYSVTTVADDGARVTRYGQRTEVVQSTLAEIPDATALMPEGADFLRADVFPATRFDDMSAETREKYRTHYQAFLMWRRAHALGKTVADLVPWVDYDAVFIDESVQRWAFGAQRYCGS
jgi:hypothetical protein